MANFFKIGLYSATNCHVVGVNVDVLLWQGQISSLASSKSSNTATTFPKALSSHTLQTFRIGDSVKRDTLRYPNQSGQERESHLRRCWFNNPDLDRPFHLEFFDSLSHTKSCSRTLFKVDSCPSCTALAQSRCKYGTRR